MIHLFGNPAIPKVRTRGFASSDFSDFARSEFSSKIKVLFFELFKVCMHPNYL